MNQDRWIVGDGERKRGLGSRRQNLEGQNQRTMVWTGHLQDLICFSPCSHLSDGWDPHRQAEEELTWGVALFRTSAAADLPFDSYPMPSQSLGWCPALPPSPSSAATTFWTPSAAMGPRVHIHYWTGTQVTLVPLTTAPLTAHPCTGTPTHPCCLPGPQAPELVPWTKEVGSG